MDDIPLSLKLGALVALLVLSALFSMTETSMMAANRFRLRHRAQAGHRGARKALALLGRMDQMLGVILLGNNLVNAAAATLVSVIAIDLFGEEKWALGAGTLLVTFAILVFSEISPKIVGAAHADRLAPIASHLLAPLLRLAYPLVWFVNLFASALLRALRLKPESYGDSPRLSPEELRALVLENSHLLPQKHQSALLNLFELGCTTVEDVMSPRGTIETIDIELPWSEIRERLATSHHTRVVACAGDLDDIRGILHLRHVVGRLGDPDWRFEDLLATLQQPYFVPASTAALAQLQFFQENRQRLALVVDEYGEVLGLVTPEDILEEIVGEFTSSTPNPAPDLAWDGKDSALVEGARSVREINRKLGLSLPTDGPNTLNGLIIEHFQDIPEAGVSIKLGDVPVEIIQTLDRSVKMARLFKPLSR